MEYPKELFRNIYWSFSEGEIVDQEIFITELKAYHKAVSGANLTIDFNEVIFNYPQIMLQYVKYTEDDVEEPQELLIADNGLHFTVGELLFKMHSQVGINLENDDNCYFEGLTFATDDDPNETKALVYFLDTGS